MTWANQKKFEHTKMDNLVYAELQIQDYLLDEDISTEQERTNLNSEL